jgi:hypothetical protein
MGHIRHAVVGLLVGACAPATLVAPALAQTCACAPTGGSGSYVIQADEAPPPLPEYDQPPIPAPGYYWTPGYWAWNNVDYYWVPGVWVEPPQPGLLWTPGYWAFVGGVYAFQRGYWGPQVGFYGGINYGFGYTGNGYLGGRWQGQNFYYNTAVNNIRTTQITNVYNNPVVVNNVTTINRVSYNGGAGGVVAAPTPQQLSAASQPHIPPTPAQQNQIRAASVQPQQFMSTNQGKPAVAATPLPGAFNAKGAVPAKAAGSAQGVPQPVQNVQPPAPAAQPNAQQKAPPAPAPIAAPPKPPAAATAPAVQPPPAPIAAPPKPPAAATAPAVQPTPSPVAAPPKPPPPAPAAVAAPPKPPAPPPPAPASLAAPKPPPPPAAIVAPRPQIAPPPPAAQLRPQPPPVVAAPPPAVERRPPPPPGKQPPPCGRPGEPACPK